MRMIVTIVSAVLATSGFAHAGHPLTVDDGGTVEAGAIELEVVAAVERPGDGGVPVVVSPGVMIHLGLTGFLDFGFGLGLQIAPVPGGRTDLPFEPVADLKLRFTAPSGARPGASIRLDWSGPGFGPGAEPAPSIGAVLLFGWEGRNWAAWFNAGSGLDLPPIGPPGVDGARPMITLLGGASVRGEIGRGVGLVWDVFVEAAPEDADGAVSGLVGVDIALAAPAVLSVGLGPVIDFAGDVCGLLTVGLTLVRPPAGLSLGRRTPVGTRRSGRGRQM